MPSKTSIQIPTTLKARLRAKKLHPRETYAEVLDRVLEDAQPLGPRTQRAVEKSLRLSNAGQVESLEDVKRELRL